MYSFTHTNITFLFKHLPTKIVIFINFCYQMKCFSGDSFYFLGAGFANILPTFLISCEFQTRYSKALKYSEQYIRDHLSGTKVKDLDLLWIWCCFYFFLHCLVQVIHLLCHIIFIIRIRLWIFKQSTCTLYASEILLFKVFINACKLAGKMLVDWSFLISVWNSVSSFSVSVTDWILSWSSIQWV